MQQSTSDPRGRRLRAAAIGMAVAVSCLLLTGWPPARRFIGNLEARLTDLRLRSLTLSPAAADSRLLIVDIDRRSIEKMGPFHSWSRARLAELLRRLHEGGAAVVVLDLLLDAGPDPAADSLLLSTMRATDITVAGASFSDADSATFLYAMRHVPQGMEDAAVPYAGDLGALWQQDRLEGALPGIYSAACWGFVNAYPDADGVIRRAPLLATFAGQAWPSLALAAAVPAMGWQGLTASGNGRRLLLSDTGTGDSRDLPLDGRGNLLLRYRGPWQTFRTVSYHDVLAGRLPPGFLRNKVVLVGSSLAGLADLRPVPQQAAFPGVEIHATLLSNIISGDPLRDAGRWGLALMLMLAALPSALAFSQRRSLPGILLVIGVLGMIWGAGAYALGALGLQLPVALPALAAIAAGGGALLQRLLVEERQRRWLAGAFSHYVSQDLLTVLQQHPERLRLGGDRRTLSLLFCDIRGFTSISEHVPPAELGSLLNRFLTAMSRVILEQGGTLDKYVGDAIIAFFGAPVEQDDHARRALLTAREMQRRMAPLRSEFAGTAFENIEIGIGVHCGPVLVGNFGSDLRFDYTVIGDAMNLASRLEGLTKAYRCHILVSREILAAAGDGFSTRLLDRIRVLGKQHPVEVHELFAGDLQREAELKASYEKARACYASGDFAAAGGLFRAHMDRFPGDGAARALLGRCELLADNPREGWDGVWQMDRK